MTTQALERRYRRLLAWYPASYREANADEMLGVALARSAAGQRWPGLGETVSLITGAIRTRTGLASAGIRSEAWQRASAAVTLIGALMLASAAARQAGTAAISVTYLGDSLNGYLSRGALAECAGWTLVAVATMVRWRRIAAIGAVAGFAGEIARYLHVSYPWTILDGWATLVLAATVAVTGLIAVPYRSQVLSRPAILTLGAAVIVTGPWPLAQALLGDQGAAYVAFNVAGVILGAGAVLAGLIVVGRLMPPVRRRVLVVLAPAVTVFFFAHWTGGSFSLVSLYVGEMPGQFVSAQWAYVAGMPVAVFLGGMLWLARYERALGRAPEEGAVT
jgi:hypothetical protein